MNGHLHINVNSLERKHENKHEKYEYFVRKLAEGGAGGCTVAQYEIPPGKSAYPYHYHVKDEEAFYILSGKGLLRTPDGEKEVSAGEFLYFPAGEAGAHKITNISKTENFVYLDFDIKNDLDVCLYPDSGKFGIWGKGIDKCYKSEQAVDYYDGE